VTAPAAASNAYTDAVATARRRGYRLGALAQEQLIAAFRDAARQVEFELQASDQPMTEARAGFLRDQLDGILRELERTTGTTTDRSVRRTIEDVVRIHERVVTEIFERYRGTVSTQVLDRLARVNVRAAAVLAARAEVGGGAAGFRTLMKYHMEQAAPDLDRMIQSAIARGVSTRRLTRDIADFLANGVADVEGYGLEPSDTSGLATLNSDARRIAVSETLNALRESQAEALEASSVVDAVKWQVSGRHAGLPSSPDECDILAESDLYEQGPGWYPVSRIPIAPHPWCACTTGETRLRPPSEWGSPRPPAAGLAVDWERFDPARHVRGAGEWSELRTQRAVTALRRSVVDPVGRRARRAA
jgi:hypothetical protein